MVEWTVKKRGDAQRLLKAAVKSNTDDCIVWPYYCHTTGSGVYPQITYNGQTSRVHRLVCRMAHGEPFAGAQAAHSCDNSKCINPRHLSWKTNLENQQDRHGKNKYAKLTKEDVELIRELRSQGVKLKELSKRYGCSEATISAAAKGTYYRWVSKPAEGV